MRYPSSVVGLVLAFALILPIALVAQNPEVAPDHYVVWNQPGPSLTAVRTYRYTARVDGGNPTVLAGVTCTNAVAPATGFDCGVVNPAPSPGAHTMVLSYAIPLAGGNWTGESPTGNCAWTTIGNPTQPPSNFRWLRLIGGVFVAIWKAIIGIRLA